MGNRYKYRGMQRYSSPLNTSLFGSIWTPAALFAQGQQGRILPSRPIVDGQQVLWQDEGKTDPVSVDGDPVRVRVDLSGNNSDGVAPSSAARAVYRTDGTHHWLEYDGTDDIYLIQGVTDGQGCGTFAFAIRPDPTKSNWALLGNSEIGPYGWAAFDGATGGPFRRYTSNPTVWINNIAQSGLTRGSFFTAAQGDNVISGRGGIYGSEWETPVRHLMQGTVIGRFKGRDYGVVEVLDNDISDEDHTLLDAYLRGQMP